MPVHRIVQSQDSGYTYYTRYFTGTQPALMAPPVTAIGSFMILTIWGDNSTWSVTLWAPSGDRALKQFRDPEKFDARRAGVPAARALARRHADHRRAADGRHPRPLPPLRRRRRTDRHRLRGGRRRVGVHQPVRRARAVDRADARAAPAATWCAPSSTTRYGFAQAWDAVTEAEIAPWYWHQLATDRARLDEMDAVREGRADVVQTVVPLPPQYEAAGRAAAFDADVFRALLETIGCLALPDEVFARPGLWDKVLAAAPGRADRDAGPDARGAARPAGLTSQLTR